MARQPGRRNKRRIMRRKRRPGIAPGCERLEPRSMLSAVPFKPLDPDPWGFDERGDRVGANDRAASIDAVPQDISLPAGLAPRQTWALRGNEMLVLYGSRAGGGTFRRYDRNGADLSWPTTVSGNVRDVAPIFGSDGFVDGLFVWGTVTSAAEASWISGGFDTTFGGSVDGFVARLRSDGTLAWATLIGAAGADTVESVAIDPDGTTVYVVGDTSSSGGFVNGTADQVHDATTVTDVSLGIDVTTGLEVTSARPPAGVDAGAINLGFANNPLAGTASSVNGYVLVMSADGRSHIWSSYLSPNDPRAPQPAGRFTAPRASFVTDVAAGVAAIVTESPSVGAGGVVTSNPQIVTLRRKSTVTDPGQTGPRPQDFEFTGVTTTGIDGSFLSSVRSRPATTANSASRFFYYMNAPTSVEIDTVAYDPVLQIPGVQGTPSRRSIGLNEFRLDNAGNAIATRVFVLEVSTFSLTGYFATPTSLYLTGTALSEDRLDFGTSFSRYHTWRQPGEPEPSNNYGDAVLVELTPAGGLVRSQFVGNADRTTRAVGSSTPTPTRGVKEKGGAIVGFPDGTVKLLGTVHAQPAPRQGTSPITGGKLWTYQTGNAFLPAPAPPPGPVEPPPPPGSGTAPPRGPVAVRWTGYVAGTTANDVIGDVWTIPDTAANQLPDDKIVIQANGVRDGYQSRTLGRGAWDDSSIRGTVTQVQLNSDATRLYATGSTTTAAWTRLGFDNTLGTFPLNARVNNSNDGFFARLETAGGKAEYSTYLGGDGEGLVNYNNDLGIDDFERFFGDDFSSAFFVNPRQSGNDVYVVGRTNVKSGLAGIDGITDDRQQAEFFNNQRVWPRTSFDDVKSRATDSRRFDGVVYSLKDRPNGIGQNQLNWAAYLTPRQDSGFTDDNEGITAEYLRMNRADFVWLAADSRGPGFGNVVYVFGEDEVVVGFDNQGREIVAQSKQIYVFNDLEVNDPSRPITDRIKKYPFSYETPDQILVDPAARRRDGSQAPAVYFRVNQPAIESSFPPVPEVSLIRRVNLPASASVNEPLKDLQTDWLLDFTKQAGNEIRPVHMAINGEKLYVASTVRNYEWPNFQPPLSSGKLRNGPSDAALLQLDAVRGTLDWWMIQGGDGADVGKAVAALPGDRVWLVGETTSQITERH